MRKREKENHEIVFGPNGQGHVYKPAPYHSYKAAERKDKTRWVDDANFEYSIFNLADVHTGLPYPENIKVIDKRWMNDRRDYLRSCVESALLSSVYFLPIVARYESKPIVEGRT